VENINPISNKICAKSALIPQHDAKNAGNLNHVFEEACAMNVIKKNSEIGGS
jgi:hypothetical protein